MNRIMQHLSSIFAAIPDALRPYRKPIALIVFVGTAFLAPFAHAGVAVDRRYGDRRDRVLL